MGDAKPLDEAARQAFANLPEAREVYPTLTFSAEWAQGNEKPRAAAASATPVSAKESDAFAKIQGKFFSSAQSAEVLLQKGFAAELTGGAASAIRGHARKATSLASKLTFTYPQRTPVAGGGFNVTNRSQTVEVVGIVDSDPGGGRGRGPDGGIRLYLPLEYAENLHVMQASDLRSGGAVYQSLVVRLKSPAQAASAEAAIKKMGFNVFSAIDATSNLRQVFAVVDLFLGAFGSLALAVASIGIVNTLVMAILERRREIGIMKAVGASDTDVRKIVFLAAGRRAGRLLAGALGIAMGWSIGRIINFGVNVYIRQQGLPSVEIWFVPLWLVGGALAFSIGSASLLSGAWPCRPGLARIGTARSSALRVASHLPDLVSKLFLGERIVEMPCIPEFIELRLAGDPNRRPSREFWIVRAGEIGNTDMSAREHG